LAQGALSAWTSEFKSWSAAGAFPAAFLLAPDMRFRIPAALSDFTAAKRPSDDGPL